MMWTAPQPKSSNEQFVFENEDCKLTYNFWGMFGNASVVFTNKTDQNLFVFIISIILYIQHVFFPFL